MSSEFDRRDWAEQFTVNVKSGDTWFRGLQILVLLLALTVARFVLYFATAYQFCFFLVRGRPSDIMLPVGYFLARYIEKIALFMTWNSDDAPFPFSPLADVTADAPYAAEDGTEDYDAPYQPPTTDFGPESYAPPSEPSTPAETPEEEAPDSAAKEPETETGPDEDEEPPAPPRPDA